MQAFPQTVLLQHRSAGARQKLLACLQEHIAAINSNDYAEAAGGCYVDGTSLLAALGLDGQQQVQASAPAAPRRDAAPPAKRKVSPAFVYSGNRETLIFPGRSWDRQPRRGGGSWRGSKPDGSGWGSKSGDRWRGSEPGERWRGSEPGERGSEPG